MKKSIVMGYRIILKKAMSFVVCMAIGCSLLQYNVILAEDPEGEFTINCGEVVDVEKGLIYAVDSEGDYSIARWIKGNVPKDAIIEIPETENNGHYVWNVYDNAFLNCKNLKKLVVYSSIEIIGALAFFGCTNLEELTIETAEVSKIGYKAFSGCQKLKSLVIPRYLKTYLSNTEENNTGLCISEDDKIIIDGEPIEGSLVTYNDADYDPDETQTTYDTYDRPSDNGFIERKELITVDGIVLAEDSEGDYSIVGWNEERFPSNGELEYLKDSDGYVWGIGNGSFINCDKIKSLRFDGKIEQIGQYAFAGCTGLETLTIDSITITGFPGYRAFEGCTNLKKLRVPFILSYFFKLTEQEGNKSGLFINENDEIVIDGRTIEDSEVTYSDFSFDIEGLHSEYDLNDSATIKASCYKISGKNDDGDFVYDDESNYLKWVSSDENIVSVVSDETNPSQVTLQFKGVGIANITVYDTSNVDSKSIPIHKVPHKSFAVSVKDNVSEELSLDIVYAAVKNPYCYKTKLSQVLLPDGWEWVESNDTVLEIGESNHVAYHKVDSEKYDYSGVNGFNKELSRIEMTLTLISEVDKSNWGEVKSVNGIEHYVAENGETSVEVKTEDDIVWLKEESDGTSAWYGFDNSNGVFKKGSRAHVRWLSKNDGEDFINLLNKIDLNVYAMVEDGKLWIFDIGVVDPDGNEYKLLESSINFFVQLGEDWNADEIRGYYISSSEDESVETEYKNMSYPEGEGVFGSMRLKHFSPYLIFDELKDNDGSTEYGRSLDDSKSTTDSNLTGYSSLVSSESKTDSNSTEYSSSENSKLTTDSSSKGHSSTSFKSTTDSSSKGYSSTSSRSTTDSNSTGYGAVKATGDQRFGKTIWSLLIMTLLSAAYLFLKKKKTI